MDGYRDGDSGFVTRVVDAWILRDAGYWLNG